MGMTSRAAAPPDRAAAGAALDRRRHPRRRRRRCRLGDDRGGDRRRRARPVHLSRLVDGRLDGHSRRCDPRGAARARRRRRPVVARAPADRAAVARGRAGRAVVVAGIVDHRRAARQRGACRPLVPGAIVVGSKNFTEQLILGEIVAQTIERETGLPVRAAAESRRHADLRSRAAGGDIDVYVEYTGTALTAIFQPAAAPPIRQR